MPLSYSPVPPKVIALGALVATGPNALLPCIRDACDAIAPLVRDIYTALHDDTHVHDTHDTRHTLVAYATGICD